MGKDMARDEETAARRPEDDPEEGKEAPVNKNKRYRRDKPWDSEDIDHWKVSAHGVGAAQAPERVAFVSAFSPSQCCVPCRRKQDAFRGGWSRVCHLNTARRPCG